MRRILSFSRDNEEEEIVLNCDQRRSFVLINTTHYEDCTHEGSI